MIRGLYTAASGMLATGRELDLITNNLANVNTTGYKKVGATRKSFSEMLFYRLEGGRKEQVLGSLSSGVQLAEAYTDFKNGNLRKTGNRLDFALRGNGFFAVQTPRGVRYTRNGNFTLNEGGEVVTKQGFPVLNQDNQPLNLENIDELNIVDFDDRKWLTREGANLFRADQRAGLKQAEDYTLLYGYLEDANVDVIKEMVNVIQANRLYEANQKVIQGFDSTLEKVVNEVGRLG